MLTIMRNEEGEILLSGRWDATQTDKAEAFFRTITGSGIVNFSHLEYISSAGLGILLVTQKRLMVSGGGLKLTNLNSHIANVFKYSGLDRIFQITTGAPQPNC